MEYTINDFWKPRLTAPDRGTEGVLSGWHHVESGLNTFLEAPLALNSSISNADPKESSVILVSAPGAVGKSTLACQIAHETGAMIVDLAKAGEVGGNTLVGGLARTGLYAPFQKGEAALIIDGLDEARMRVPKASFEVFLCDLKHLAVKGRKPIVLFGRTGAVEDTWLELAGLEIEVPILEIGYYEPESALEFAKIQAQDIRGEQTKREPDGRAIELLLEGLRSQTASDGDNFSGYAPVLIAVAKQVADPDESTDANTQALIARIGRGESQITLDTIARSILDREHRKLEGLQFDDESLRDRLYTPNEQLRRLVERLYPGTPLPDSPTMSVQDQERYNGALESWVTEHPFLTGDGKAPSSAVFGGLIAAKALSAGESAAVALNMELDRGTAINPFLAEFYVNELKAAAEGEELCLPAEHTGVVYASMRARLALDETAGLRIDREPQGNDIGVGEGEIVRSNSADKLLKPLCFTMQAEGHIRLGAQVEDVDIVAPNGRVSIGHASEAIFVAPVFIEAGEIELTCERIVVAECRRNRRANAGKVVHLTTKNLSAPHVTSLPLRHGDVRLEVCFPGSERYPWKEFATPPQEEQDPRVDEALRRLRKILRLFRSHGNDRLAKYCDAIEHRRRTQGCGQCVLDQLLKEKVLTIEGPMYFLDPDRLSDAVGLNFNQVSSTRSDPRTIEFVERALSRNG